MKPRRTVESTNVLSLPGGTEDNDLWFTQLQDEEGNHIFESVWTPTDKERVLIANGQNIALRVWGKGHPPVSLVVTDVELGRPHAE